MEQPHQHGPQCKHGHGAPGGHGHGGHGHQRPSDVSPKQYFQKVALMKKTNPQFYWMEILSGNYFNKYCQNYGLDIVQSINCQIATMLIAQAQMMFSCDWMPLALKPFVSGLFFPLVFLLFFNFNVIFGVASPDTTFLHLYSYVTLLFYTLTALRQAGDLSTFENQQKSQKAIQKRIYLQNPGANCGQCKILKVFRAFHCPLCKVCVSKFTRHSLAFGGCIGSSNQLLAFGFFVTLTITQVLTLQLFFGNTQYGLITNFMFYILNICILWLSFVEVVTLAVMNFYFGLTEHESRAWMMNQYLIKAPARQFVNSVGKGLVNNLIQSFYSLLNISGYQSQQKNKLSDNPMQEQIPISQQSNSQFQKLDKNKSYLINWSKAFFYLLPQLPSHPSRDQVLEIMIRDQPRMMEMYKLQRKFKQEVIKQTEGQGLNEFQIQQRVGAKMQQYMMKNQANMMAQMAPPSPDQQKVMQIQMLTHMIGQLSQKQPEITQRIQELLKNLKQSKASVMQVGMSMRQIQQDLMKKQMQAVMKQRQDAQKAKQTQQNQDEQEQLKTKQIADEDL